MFDDLIIYDKEVAERILEELKQPRDNTIKPAFPDKLPPNFKEVWLNTMKNKGKMPLSESGL